MSHRSGSNPESDESASPAARLVFRAIGCLLVIVGAVGVVLPVLPTTPFLLLASYFFGRSSPRLQQALLRSRLFGPILRDWREHRGVRIDTKLRAIVTVAGVIGLTLYFADLKAWPRVVMLILAAVGIAVITRLPSIPPDDVNEPERSDSP